MTWSIAEVARMTRVTSRTLRHYDDMGLLAPAYVGANGQQEQKQMLRLQQILLLRELGVGLETISEVLAGQRDRVEALRGHERWLRGPLGSGRRTGPGRTTPTPSARLGSSTPESWT